MGKLRGSNWATIAIVCSFILGLLLLILPAYRPDQMPLFLLLLGRFHPLILHFPIVLILLALVFEIVRHKQWIRQADGIIIVTLVTASISTVIAVLAGFFLFASGEYSGQLMDQHFLGGAITGTAILLTLAFFLLFRRKSQYYPLYLIFLIASNLTVAWTGHLGGSITHGADYLTEYVPFLLAGSPTDEPRSEEEMLVYADMVAPIFDAKCLSCHNQMRTKGGLLMNSMAALVKGGESGKPGLTAGDPEQSELFNRVILPYDHDDHMPPQGKSPMTEDEIALLKFWIASGASEELMVAEAKTDPEVGAMITTLVPEMSRYRRQAAIARLRAEALEQELEQLASKLAVSIRKDSAADEDLYIIAMKFPPAPFTNDQFRQLASYNEVFSRASLVASGIDDAGLFYISRMVNLKELYLQKTKLDGTGLVHLQSLPNLEVLNLAFTKVDDKSALDLLNFPNLKTVYLFGTLVTPEVVEALRKYKPRVNFLMEEGPYL